MDFLDAFADLNSGFRMGTENTCNAPADQITYSKEGGVGCTRGW